MLDVGRKIRWLVHPAKNFVGDGYGIFARNPDKCDRPLSCWSGNGSNRVRAGHERLLKLATPGQRRTLGLGPRIFPSTSQKQLVFISTLLEAPAQRRAMPDWRRNCLLGRFRDLIQRPTHRFAFRHFPPARQPIYHFDGFGIEPKSRFLHDGHTLNILIAETRRNRCRFCHPPAPLLESSARSVTRIVSASKAKPSSARSDMFTAEHQSTGLKM